MPRLRADFPARLRLRLGIALVAAVWAASDALPRADDGVMPSTREMASLLAERAAAVDPDRLWFNVNTKRAELRLRAARAPHAGRGRRFGIQFAGELAFSVSTTRRSSRSIVWSATPTMWAPSSAPTRTSTSCCSRPPRSCGWAKSRTAPTVTIAIPVCSRSATRVCISGGTGRPAPSRCSSACPDRSRNLRARWLLNIAHMTLGTYPDGVVPSALIPPKAGVDGPVPALGQRRRRDRSRHLRAVWRRGARGLERRRPARPRRLGDRVHGSMRVFATRPAASSIEPRRADSSARPVD